ncbi:RBBP9/YdeN family alpha/beta hydrolase [Thiofilum flexile]|uniref:RBBP9/YdeN family alpha/beta hydrolase n=1 Tax=Thiofilum flexile TaxID=125627 RepID=UPI00036989F9|nr:alpha/beta hydrolase [Thiofilum flexile]
MTQILILPGIGNSGSEHWQTLWEQKHSNFQRVIQDDWDYPICAKWVERLDEAVAKTGKDTVLVAHSLACLMVAHWAQTTKHSIRGALLVAVPDPDGEKFPSEAKGFTPLPKQRFAFPSLIVASANDPYGTLDYSKQCAQHWGSDWITIGLAGHINAASGLGVWSQGEQLLEKLLQASQ